LSTNKIPIGANFNRLTITGEPERRGQGKYYYPCKCSCGTKNHFVRADGLKNGSVKSCGCLQKEAAAQTCVSRSKHSLKHSDIYNIWVSIKARCNNKNATNYERYGAKGVYICEEWAHDVLAFAKYMGVRPSSKHSIDRIDNNLGYEPGNVRWASPSEQGYNRSSTNYYVIEEEKLNLLEISSKYKIPIKALKFRIYHGWSIERAISTPYNGKYNVVA
jgi:hypothetical protein